MTPIVAGTFGSAFKCPERRSSEMWNQKMNRDHLDHSTVKYQLEFLQESGIVWENLLSFCEKPSNKTVEKNSQEEK